MFYHKLKKKSIEIFKKGNYFLIKCMSCKKIKLITEFELYKIYRNVNLNILSGDPEAYRHNMCNSCNRRNRLLKGAETRAAQKGLDFDLKLKDIKIPNFCPVLGIELRFGKGKMTDASPTLDRIDNLKGYTKDNIIVISWRANRLKCDASLQELSQIADFYKKYQEN